MGEIDAVAGRGARYGWDGRGHVIEERRGVASGSAAHVILQSDARLVRYGYDSEGRRIVTELAGEGPIRESYDVDGLRIEREGEGRAERYQYSEGRLLATTNGMNAVTRRLRYAGLGRRVLGPALGLVLGFSGGVSEGYQAHLDALGSPLALTRTDGAVAERTRYGVWGEVEVRATPDTNLATTPNPLTWQGYVADADAGGASASDGATTYYAYQRHYQVGVGRFTSRDPWAGDANNPITLNEYLGLNANPLRYVDPDGRCPVDSFRCGLVQSVNMAPNAQARASAEGVLASYDADAPARAEGAVTGAAIGSVAVPGGLLLRATYTLGRAAYATWAAHGWRAAVMTHGAEATALGGVHIEVAAGVATNTPSPALMPRRSALWPPRRRECSMRKLTRCVRSFSTSTMRPAL
jgi:RHS repeat-associated protein